MEYDSRLGWTPFIQQANELLRENKLLKEDNKELQGRIKELQDQIECYKYLQSMICDDVVPIKESYYNYRNRVHRLVNEKACFPPEWEYFYTSPGLNKKFDEYGRFKPFYGDTTVFYLPINVKSALFELHNELYGCAGHMLSERLPPDTFHITLHDLSSGETGDSVKKELELHNRIVPVLVDSMKQKGTVRLRSAGIVSMVSSSLVMLFEPVSDTDHNTIQRVYNVMDTVKHLSYPLTLHCTLAYYKPGNYSPEKWNMLIAKVMELNQRKPIEVELDCTKLEYQHFSSMKEYYQVFEESC